MKELQLHTMQSPCVAIIDETIISHLHDFVNEEKELFILCDSNVFALYPDLFTSMDAPIFLLKSTEKRKSLQTYQRIIRAMQQHNCSKDTTLLCVGGGIIGDIGGFVASTYMRGITHILVPTTLLAQVDAAVGGKTALNTKEGKNSIGSYYYPKKILIDPLFNNTLLEKDFASGIAEIIKYGLIADATLIDKLTAAQFFLSDIIESCILIKHSIITKDPKDQNQRLLLNFGHTFAHGLEAAYKNKYTHGQAVALGMWKMLYNLSFSDKERIQSLYTQYHLATHLPYSLKKIRKFIYQDKKRKNEELREVFIDTIGKPSIRNITLSSFFEILSK